MAAGLYAGRNPAAFGGGRGSSQPQRQQTWNGNAAMPTLLVVDDETPILHAFGRVFRAPDVQLVTATTAAEGLKLLERHRPDAVILDINLPDQSGLAAYGKLRRIDARVPVLF